MRWLLLAMLLVGAGCDDAPAGPVPDATVDGPQMCTFEGRACDPVYGCSDGRGCVWCWCYFSSSAVCNQIACGEPDGGPLVPRECVTSADCPDGQPCLYEQGCASSGLCFRKQACLYPNGSVLSGSVDICGCDGKTATVQASCGVSQPYRHLGACP
jgi:hypothetical protein